MGHDHPHARGEDEIYRFAHTFEVNVDLARRLLASGDIGSVDCALSPLEAGRKLLGLPEEMFGAARDGGYGIAADVLENMGARTYVDTAILASIPDEAFERPLLMLTWSNKGAEAVSARMRKARPDASAAADRVFRVLVDGNHRLARAFLEGRTRPMSCPVVTEWSHVERFLSCEGRPATSRPRATHPRRCLMQGADASSCDATDNGRRP